MTTREVKWVEEIPMREGESMLTLDTQLSEFFGRVVVLDLRRDGRSAMCEFRSHGDGEAFLAVRASQAPDQSAP